MGFVKEAKVSPLYTVPVAWIQPTFTSNTTWGSLTASSYVNSSNAIYYALNKAYGVTDSSGWLGSSSTSTSEWWQWEFEEDLYVKNVRVYQTDKCATTSVQMYSLEGFQLSEDLELEQTTTSYVDITFDYPTLLSGFKLVVTGDGSSYCGIGEIEMTAFELAESSESSTEISTVKTSVSYEGVEDWEQPIFTDYDTWGTVSATTENDESEGYAWKALDGNTGADNTASYTWESSGSTNGYWNWDFEDYLLVSNIRVYQRVYSSSFHTNYITVYYYSTKFTLFSMTAQVQEAGGYIDFTFDEPTLIKNLYIYAQGTSYVGIGEVVLTAQTVDLTPVSTVSTVDFSAVSKIVSVEDSDGNITYSLSTEDFTPDVEYKVVSNKKYYKYTDWEVPYLTEAGTLGESDFAVSGNALDDDDSYEPYHAFNDPSLDEYFYHSVSGSSSSPNYDITFYVKGGIQLQNIKFINRSDDPSCVYPLTSVTVLGSNDGENWTEIGCAANPSTYPAAVWDMPIIYDTKNPEIYEYFYLDFKTSYSYVALDYIGITGVQITESDSSDYDFIEYDSTEQYDKAYNLARTKNGVLRGYRSVRPSEPIYMNWCPWTMPILEEDGVIYGLKSDNNYGASVCCYYTKYNGTILSSRSYAYHAFAGSITDSWIGKQSSETSNHAGTSVSYDDDPDYCHTLVFHSPCFIKLTALEVGIGDVAKLQIYGSYDGTTVYSVGEYDFNEYQQTGSPYWGISGYTNQSDYNGRYLYNRCGIYISEGLQKAYKYIIFKIFPTVITAESSGSYGYYNQPCFNAILSGDVLDTVAWTDSETYDWEMPYLTGAVTSTDYGNITVSASSSGGLLPYEIFSEDYASNYSYGWCPCMYVNEDDGATGWWMIKFPYMIALTKLVHYNYNANWGTGNSALTGQFYADELMETSIGDEFTLEDIGNTECTETVIFNDSENPIVTNTIFFLKKAGGRYSGISHLDIEGRRLSYTEADSTNAKYVVTSTSCLPANEEYDSFWSTLLLVIEVVAVIGTLALSAASGGSTTPATGSIMTYLLEAAPLGF